MFDPLSGRSNRKTQRFQLSEDHPIKLYTILALIFTLLHLKKKTSLLGWSEVRIKSNTYS